MHYEAFVVNVLKKLYRGVLNILAKTLKLENCYKIVIRAMLRILGLQPRDKAAMLVVNTKEIFLLNLHQNGVHFPAERDAFVLDHQHGRRDVTCKPAIKLVLEIAGKCRNQTYMASAQKFQTYFGNSLN